MGKRTRLNIVDHIKEMTQLEQSATEAQVEAAMKNPVVAAQKIEALLEEFRLKGSPDFLINDPEYAAFLKDMDREITSSCLAGMRLCLELLVKNLQENGQFVTAKDLSGIIRDLGNEVKARTEKPVRAEVTDNAKVISELDHKIAELERELLSESGTDNLDS